MHDICQYKHWDDCYWCHHKTVNISAAARLNLKYRKIYYIFQEAMNSTVFFVRFTKGQAFICVLFSSIWFHFIVEVKRFTRKPMNIVNETLIRNLTDAINHLIMYHACERQCIHEFICWMLKRRRWRIVSKINKHITCVWSSRHLMSFLKRQYNGVLNENDLSFHRLIISINRHIPSCFHTHGWILIKFTKFAWMLQWYFFYNFFQNN